MRMRLMADAVVFDTYALNLLMERNLDTSEILIHIAKDLARLVPRIHGFVATFRWDREVDI